MVYSPKAKADLKIIKDLGFDKLPVCIAKTQKSLSDDEKKIGRPTGFDVTVRGFEFAAGAGGRYYAYARASRSSYGRGNDHRCRGEYQRSELIN